MWEGFGSIPKAESELKGWIKSWRFEVLGCSSGNGWAVRGGRGGRGADSICVQRLSPRSVWGFGGCGMPDSVSGILGAGLM